MSDYKDDNGYNPQTIYLIDIKIVRGCKLKKADLMGLSDPYVKVQCLHRTFNTDVLKKTLEPEWNACTQFVFHNQPKEICFRCIDWNMKPPNTPIGDFTLALKEEWFKKNNPGFMQQKVKLERVITGEIEIEVKCQQINIVELVSKKK
eukprot:235413_1